MLWKNTSEIACCISVLSPCDILSIYIIFCYYKTGIVLLIDILYLIKVKLNVSGYLSNS